MLELVGFARTVWVAAAVQELLRVVALPDEPTGVIQVWRHGCQATNQRMITGTRGAERRNLSECGAHDGCSAILIHCRRADLAHELFPQRVNIPRVRARIERGHPFYSWPIKSRVE